MAEKKPDWVFWTFWVTTSAALMAAGALLPAYEYPILGKRLIFAGLAILGISIVSPALTPLYGVFKVAPALLARILRFILRACAVLYQRAGAFILRPIFVYLLRERGVSHLPTLAWTAEQKRGQRGSDFLAIAKSGYRVTGARFVVRPDYTYPLWHAGFRLTRAAENLEQAELRSTVLVQVTQARAGEQVIYTSHREQADWGPWGLQNYPRPIPSFLFDVSINSRAENGKLVFTYSINADTPQSFDFPQSYAEQLVLVAWADGQDYRVYFEQISVSWIPLEG